MSLERSRKKKISEMSFPEFSQLVGVASGDGEGSRVAQERVLLFLELNHAKIKTRLKVISGSRIDEAKDIIRRFLERKVEIDGDLRFLNALIKVNAKIGLLPTKVLRNMIDRSLKNGQTQ